MHKFHTFITKLASKFHSAQINVQGLGSHISKPPLPTYQAALIGAGK